MITGVILARNEERNIEACIKNLRPFVEQLIVIDMDSSDSTRRISERFADLVMPHPLIDDFDSARNIANEAATEPWLWFADADERVSKATGELVRQLVGSLDESFAAIQIPFKTYFCGQWIQHSGWWPGYTMPRVFRKGRFEFRKGVHQGVSVLGGTSLLPPNPEIAIDHYSYLSIEHYYEKFNRYTTIEAKSLPNDGRSWNWRMGIRQMTRDLWHYYENCRGDLDGLRGWVLAWLAGQYRWAAHAKVLDLIGEGRGEGEVPDDLTAVLQEMESEVARLRVRLPPREDIGLVLRSPIFDASGYADDGRFVASVLSRLDHHFSVEEFRWRDDTAVLAPATESLLRALTRARPPQCRMTITNCIPSLVQPDPLAHLNVLRTTFETDRIPKEWLDQLDRFDEIWLFSEANRLAFLRGGAAPERIRIVPSGLDTATFTPTGLSYPLPSRLHGRFVFLSIFDWQYRKGWDILLEAFLEEFNNRDDVGLILKVTMDHGVNRHLIEQAIQAVIEKVNVKTQQRVAIEIITESLSSSEMSSLYRSVDAFVLPTRGEGWGRPFMEALACGTPVIATRGSGQQAFLDESCALLVDAHLTDVPEHAWRQVPTFQGHQWLEPNPIELRRCLRQIVDDAPLRQRLAEHGHAKVLAHYSIEASRPAFASAIDAACATWFPAPAPIADPSKVRVAIEGEFFAGHSFSNVNEEIARHLIESENLEVTILPLWQEHASTTRLPHLQSLKPYFNRDIGELEVTIRHSFPPKWNRPPSGRWIHIQPWEFGALPLDWVKPLRDEVDEIWLPSNYCREVYVNSGIPSEKIHVFPWGIDPVTYSPKAVARALPNSDCFQFLFMGGTIQRKGFDILLQAFLEEFATEEAVQLVVKDMGTSTFYRFDNNKERLLAHVASERGPRVLYIDREMTAGQRAGLYTACDCLVAPYRGEGFGLPVLEAMACGLLTIIPEGGPTDDFVPSDSCIRVPSRTQECLHGWRLADVGTELAIEVADLRVAMRQAFANQAETQAKGLRASEHAHANYGWKRMVGSMATRLRKIAEECSTAKPSSRVPFATKDASFTACISHDSSDVSELLTTLGSVRHWCHEIIIVSAEVTEPVIAIASDYRARLYPRTASTEREHPLNSALRRATSDWVIWLDSGDSVSCGAVTKLREQVRDFDPGVWGGAVRVVSAESKELDREVRVLRNVNECLLGDDVTRSPYEAIVRHSKRVTDLDIEVCVATVAPDLRQFDLTDVGLRAAKWKAERLAAAMSRNGDHFHAECLWREVFEFEQTPSELRRHVTLELMRTSLSIGDPYRADEYRSYGMSNWPEEVRFQGPCEPRLGETRREDVKLYLGSGAKTLPGYLTVDIVAGPNVDIVLDLNRTPWPWTDSSVDRIVAEDLVEHLDINLIQFCEEAWRILRPGGILYVRTPHREGDSSWIDPTHRWHYEPRSFEFLDPSTPWGKQHPHYTDRKWRLLSLGTRGPQNIHACLVPLK